MSPGPTQWLRRIGQVLLVVAAMDALLFGAAGRLDWLAAWLLSLMYLAFLQDELPGYREYASRVRYRLVPRLW